MDWLTNIIRHKSKYSNRIKLHSKSLPLLPHNHSTVCNDNKDRDNKRCAPDFFIYILTMYKMKQQEQICMTWRHVFMSSLTWQGGVCLIWHHYPSLSWNLRRRGLFGHHSPSFDSPSSLKIGDRGFLATSTLVWHLLPSIAWMQDGGSFLASTIFIWHPPLPHSKCKTEAHQHHLNMSSNWHHHLAQMWDEGRGFVVHHYLPTIFTTPCSLEMQDRGVFLATTTPLSLKHKTGAFWPPPFI